MAEQSFIEKMLSHRSIRQFKKQAVDESIIEQLVNVARFASSSNHLQCISIIRITDPKVRHELKECSGQSYVETAPEFWVFCADFNKHKQICSEANLDYTEVMLIGAVDAGIMAQNVLAAAESLGLGGVYIGSIRNNIEKAGKELGLPEYVVPLFGMCLGYPDQDPMLKPRLPKTLMFFENQYQPLDKVQLAAFDREVAEYYQVRSQLDMDWSGNVIKVLSKPVRPQVLPYLQKQGFVKK
ncbi:oxygen-insensitive NADPH nitroreductase [Pasteurella bettyae]|uniref:oxygen-insensitive NADPH nitroreductase n=1 Tax=Pasteurella bettyae TaxID=752 RepID=UPI003D288662